MELKAWQVFSLNQHQILWINIINCILVDSKEICQWDLWREMSNLWKYLIQTTWIRRELEIIMTGKMTSVCYVQTWHPLFRLGDHYNIFHMWYLVKNIWKSYVISVNRLMKRLWLQKRACQGILNIDNFQISCRERAKETRIIV